MSQALQAAAALVQTHGEPMTDGEARILGRARAYLDACRTIQDKALRYRWRVVGRCYDPKAECVLITLRAEGNGRVEIMREPDFNRWAAENGGPDLPRMAGDDHEEGADVLGDDDV